MSTSNRYRKEKNISGKVSGQGETQPPLLTGGVRLLQNVHKFRGVDWLSLSTSTTYAHKLCGVSEKKDGHINALGFSEHELRTVMGGICQRHFKPTAKSKKYGLFYELWNWTGFNAQASVAMNRPFGFAGRKCTRIDIAFDLRCDKGLSPFDVTDPLRGFYEEKGIIDGSAGEGGECRTSRYLGSKLADRRIRFYRKDLKESNWQFGPCMRIELMLRRDPANKLFAAMIRDENEGYSIAVAHIEDMCGLVLSDDVSAIPEREIVVRSSVAETMAAMVFQYGRMLDTVAECGIDLNSLLELRRETMGRATRFKDKAFLKEAHELLPADLIEQAEQSYRERL